MTFKPEAVSQNIVEQLLPDPSEQLEESVLDTEHVELEVPEPSGDLEDLESRVELNAAALFLTVPSILNISENALHEVTEQINQFYLP